jgi:hypothetical protein
MKPMQAIKNREDLEMVICELEVKAEIQKKELMEAIHNNLESLKPLSIIKKTMKNVITVPKKKDDPLLKALGFGAGLVLNKLLSKMQNGFLKNVLENIIPEDQESMYETVYEEENV